MILTVCLSPCIDVTIDVDLLMVGKTNVIKRKRTQAGGKAINVAIGASRLGQRATITGFMYKEGEEIFTSLLQKNGIKNEFILNEGRVRENFKFVDDRSMLTELNDVGAEVPKNSLKLLLDRINELSSYAEVTVISGGLPRGVPDSFYGELVEAVDRRSLVVTDATGGKLASALSKRVHLVKPNLEELENIVGRQLITELDRISACKELISRGTKYVLLSLGKEGALITDGEKGYFCKSACVAVNSTVGAGDAMVAAAAVGLSHGASMSEILRSGTAAGSAAVTTLGDISFTQEKYWEIYDSLKVTEI